MAKQTTLKVYSSLDNKIEQLEDLVDEKLRDRLEGIADYAISISPADTGFDFDFFFTSFT